MKFIKVTTKDGVELEVNPDLVCFMFRKPLEPFYSLASAGAMTAVDSRVTRYGWLAIVIGEALDNFVEFVVPEATIGYVNPKHVLFITSPQIGTTILMFIGGLKLVVKEGLTAVRQKLGGRSGLEFPQTEENGS